MRIVKYARPNFSLAAADIIRRYYIYSVLATKGVIREDIRTN
jgi:hypothetical protein